MRRFPVHLIGFLLLFTGFLLPAASAWASDWPGIRDGVLYIRAGKAVDVRWSCKEAWAARGHEETIYFQGPDGALLGRRRIQRTETSGSDIFRANAQAGDYRLEVPGYSFRAYTVSVPRGTPSLFEPAKVHCSIAIPRQCKVYFSVPQGATFSVCGKYHGGVKSLRITDPARKVATLTLKSYSASQYSSYDSLKMSNARGGNWTLELVGSGKAAFWLDGVPNLFAQSTGELFQPQLKDGAVAVTVGQEVLGPSPKIGAGMLFNDLPEQGYAMQEEMGLSAANHYAFQDLLWQTGGTDWKDRSWLRVYENRLRILDYLTIFTADRKKFGDYPPPYAELDGYAQFITTYLNEQRGNAGLQVPYVAFLDEANSRFADLPTYAAFYNKLAGAVKRDGRSSVNGVKIAMPESSNFIDGPMMGDADQRVGADWARELLRKEWDLVDALSWHEWNRRDLIATEWYNESVERAAAMLQEIGPAGAKPKDLLITQTNISSGADFSPYDQDTFFAALWWASVVIEGGRTGKLDQIDWFPSVDDSYHRKGLINYDGTSAVFRPVGRATRFLAKSLLERVLLTRDPSVEMDAMAMTDAPGSCVRVLIVNKAPRSQKLTVTADLPPALANGRVGYRLVGFGSDLTEKVLEEGTKEAVNTLTLEGTVPGECIFCLYLERAQ
ncbi:MAG: hypothetical protein V1918_04560 [Planctomycetota bacterium]